MSADNYYLIRRHPNGGYAAVMGFASTEEIPEVTEQHEQFENIEDALVWSADEYAEYGVDIHPECFEGFAEPVTPKAYTELGQWAFSNGQVQEYEAYWATSGLILLAELIAEKHGETRQHGEYENLITTNSEVEEYVNDTFTLSPYCWCDSDQPGHELACPPNFIHHASGLTISWYKHAGRGITANRPALNASDWWAILADCASSIADNGTRIQLEHTDIWLKCHPSAQCAGQTCSLHNRTNHTMRSFPQHWRGDRYLMERTCPHGVGHPDPDDYMILTGRDSGVHGCDGCCR